jgi:hypothetical protein
MAGLPKLSLGAAESGAGCERIEEDAPGVRSLPGSQANVLLIARRRIIFRKFIDFPLHQDP